MEQKQKLKKNIVIQFYFQRPVNKINHHVFCTANPSQCYLGDGVAVATQKARIIFKSQFLTFFITQSATISNIIFDGSQRLNFGFSPNNQRILGCSCDTSILDGCSSLTVAGETPNCLQKFSTNGVQYDYFAEGDSNYLLYTSNYWYQQPRGIFEFQFLTDYASASIPTMTINNCEFIYFAYNKYVNSLIYLDRNRASSLSITNSNFLFNFFQNGIITNAVSQISRDVYHHNIPSIGTCKDTNSALSISNCFSLKIMTSNFKFNGYYYPHQNNKVYQEAVVLFLRGFKGPINIEGNTFEGNVVSKLRNRDIPNTLTAQDTDCNDSSGTFFFQNQQTNIDKGLSFDKIMRYYLENRPGYQFKILGKTGSVIMIAHVERDLVLYGNTFTQNIVTTGVAMIHTWTGGTKILMKANNFYKNYAIFFGTSFVLLNYEIDFYTMSQKGSCAGVLADSNNFEKNMGCTSAFGNMIISCEPRAFAQQYQDYSSTSSTVDNDFGKYDLLSYYNFDSTGAYVDLNDDFQSTLWTNFLQNETSAPTPSLSTVTVYSLAAPSTVSIDTTILQVTGNSFIKNYLTQNNALYIQGASRVKIMNNIFNQNYIPLGASTWEDFQAPINAYSQIIGMTLDLFTIPDRTRSSQQKMLSSNLIVRLCNNIDIDTNTFTQNGAFGQTFDTPEGLAITITDIIGGGVVNIKNNIFDHLQGAPNQGILNGVLNSNQASSTSGMPLMTFSYLSTEINNLGQTLPNQLHEDFPTGSCDGQVFHLECKINTVLSSNGISRPRDVSPKIVIASNTITNNIFGSDFEYFKLVGNDISDGVNLPTHPQYYNGIVKFMGAPSIFALNQQVEVYSNTMTNNQIFAPVSFFEFGYQHSVNINQEFTNAFNYSDPFGLLNNQENHQHQYAFISVGHQIELTSNNRRSYYFSLQQSTFNGNTGPVFYSDYDYGQFDKTQIIKWINGTNSVSKIRDIGLLTLSNLVIQNHISANKLPLIQITRASFLLVSSVMIQDSTITGNVGVFTVSNSPIIDEEASENGMRKIVDLTIKNIQMTATYGACLEISNIDQFSATNIAILDIKYTATQLQQTSSQSIRSICYLLYQVKNGVFSNLSCQRPQFVISAEVVSQQNNDYSACITLSQGQAIKVETFICSEASQTDLGYESNTQQRFALGIFKNLVKDVKITSANFEQSTLEQGLIIDSSSLDFATSSFKGFSTKKNSSVIMEIGSQSIVTLTSSQISGNQGIGLENSQSSSLIRLTQLSDLYLFKVIIQSNSQISSILSALSAKFIIISNSTISDNKEKGDAASLIQVAFTQLSISQDTYFTNNFFRDSTIKLVSSMETSIISTVFYQNFAGNSIKAKQSMGINIDQVFFDQVLDPNETQKSYNEVKTKGNMIYLENSDAQISNSVFNNGFASQGGAIYSFGDSDNSGFTIENSKFLNNTAVGHGGAIYSENPFSISNTIFDNNMAKIQGSTIYTTNKLFISNSTFTTHNLESIYLSPFASIEIEQSVFNTSAPYQIQDLSELKFKAMGIYCDQCLRFTAKSVSFSNFTHLDGGGAAILISSSSGDNFIVDSNFTNNTAAYGGAIALMNISQMSIAKTNFTQNYAIKNSVAGSGVGGGIFNGITDAVNSYLKFYCRIRFSENEAQINGGAFYNTIFNPILSVTFNTKSIYYASNCSRESSQFLSFSNNRAQYGSDFGQANAAQIVLIQEPPESLYLEYVTKINDTLSKTKGQRYLQQISGTSIYPPPVIELQDQFGQVVKTDNSSILTVSAGSEPTGKASDIQTFGDSTTFVCYKGYYILYPFSVQKAPGTTAKLKFTTTAIQVVPGTTVESSSLDISLDIVLRNCIRGEARTESFACQYCTAPTYSLFNYTSPENRFQQPTPVSCQNCPNGAKCIGGDQIGPQKNYWRYSIEVSRFIECFNEVSCLGSTLVENVTTSSTNKMRDLEALDEANSRLLAAESGNHCSSIYDQSQTNRWCSTGYCQHGYTGNLCAKCIPGYARDNDIFQTCVTCQSNYSYWARVSFVICLSIATFYFTIKENLRPSQFDKNHSDVDEQIQSPDIRSEDMDAEKPRQIEIQNINLNEKEVSQSGGNTSPKAPNSPHGYSEGIQYNMVKNNSNMYNSMSHSMNEKSDQPNYKLSKIYLKILLNYLQIVAIMGTFQFNWSQEVAYIFTSSKIIIASMGQFFSMDCVYGGMDDIITVRLFFTKVLFYSVSPFLIVGIIYLILKAYFGIMGDPQNRFKSYFITSVTVSIFLIHPNIIDFAMRSFSCINLGEEENPIYFLDADLEIQCWSYIHLIHGFLIALPSLIVWGLILPIWALKKLFMQKEEIISMPFCDYGMLFQGFKKNFFYWEFVIYFRKLAIIACSVFMTRLSVDVQAIFVLGVSTINYVAQKFLQPYDEDVLNELETRSLSASAATLYCALYFMTGKFDSTLKMMLFMAILSVNLWFLLFFVREFLIEKFKEIATPGSFLYKYQCIRQIAERPRYQYTSEFDKAQVYPM